MVLGGCRSFLLVTTLNPLVAVVYYHSRLLLDFRTVFVEIKLLSLLYYCRPFSILKTLTGYRPYSHSENRNFSSPLMKK